MKSEEGEVKVKLEENYGKLNSINLSDFLEFLKYLFKILILLNNLQMKNS